MWATLCEDNTAREEDWNAVRNSCEWGIYWLYYSSCTGCGVFMCQRTNSDFSTRDNSWCGVSHCRPGWHTSPPEVPLHNRYDPLIPNTMCNDECNTEIYKNKRIGPKTQPRANQNIRRCPNATTKVRATSLIIIIIIIEAIDTAQNGIDTILIGDSVRHSMSEWQRRKI